MSCRVDTSPLIAGACVVSAYDGLGISGAALRAATGSGGSGAGVLYNDWDAGDDAKEFRALLVTAPSSGALTMNENGSLSLTGAADGSYSLVYRLFVDGADLGTSTAAITIGSASQSFSPNPAGLTIAGFAPSFVQSSGASFSPAPAALALSGLAPAFTQTVGSNLMFSPTPAALALAGFRPVFTITDLGGGGDTGLIVEDGTGMPNAESYASVATADAYHARRPGALAWDALTTPQKESALIQATDYLQATYSTRWKGTRVKVEQALDWPRSGVVVDRVSLAYDQLPPQIVRATCELALKSLTQPLTADEGAQVKSEKVGSLEVVYADGARQQTRWVLVEQLLGPLLKVGPNTLRVTRA